MGETIIQRARGHLGAAISQSIPSDDHIIMDHVKAAYALLEFSPDIKAENERLKEINAGLVEALKFYAGAWDCYPGDSGPGGNEPQEPTCEPSGDLYMDMGETARAALAKVREA